MRNLNKTNLTLAGYIKRYISFNLIFTVVGCLLFSNCGCWENSNNASSDDSDNQTVEQAEQKIDEANKEIDKANEEIAQAKTEEEKRKAEDKKEIAEKKKEIAIHGKTIAEKKKEMAQAKTEEEKAKAAVAAARAAENKALKLVGKSSSLLRQLCDKQFIEANSKFQTETSLFECTIDIQKARQEAESTLNQALKKSFDLHKNLEKLAHFFCGIVKEEKGNNQSPTDEAKCLLTKASNQLQAVEKACKEVEQEIDSADKQLIIIVNNLIKKAKDAHNNTLEKGGKAAKEAFERIEKLYADYKAVYKKRVEAYSHLERVENTDLENEARDVWLPLANESDEAKKAFEKEKTALQALLKKP